MLQNIQRWVRVHWLLTIGIALIVVLMSAGGAVYAANISTTHQQEQVQKCGSVSTHGSFGTAWNQNSTVNQVVDCFWQAYQQCHAATISITVMGVDAGATHTITIKKAQNCQVSDTMQSYVLMKTSDPVTYSCTGVTRQQNELRITACGEAGDLVVHS